MTIEEIHDLVIRFGQVRRIGDAHTPARIMEAVTAGYEAAQELDVPEEKKM